MFGYANRLLDVDLSTKSITVFNPGEDLYEKYLGGRGLGARLLYDLLPPGADPLGRENIFLLLAGPFAGTIVPGSGKYVVITKSPATKGYVDSYASGRIAVELKFAGYDGIILRGSTATPSYLYIHNDIVEIRDAGFIWGKNTLETEDLIREAINDREVGIACIGPAGERLVKFATVNSDYFRQAARGGVGAVMGSKNIKAIVVKGSGGVKSHDTQTVMELVKQHIDRIQDSPVAKIRIIHGTPLTLNLTNAAGMLPTSNFRKGVFEEADKINAEGVKDSTIKSRGCYGCILACSQITKAKEGKYKGTVLEGPEYESLGLLGSNLEVSNLSDIIQSNLLCDQLGLDTISTGGVIGFLMECMEKGFITPADVNGLQLRFGDSEAVHELIHDIAYRQGVGNLLAEGVQATAEKIGHNSSEFAMHVKGLEFAAYDPRIGYGTALSYAVNTRGACHRRAWPPMVEVLGKENPYGIEGKAQLIKDLYNDNCVMHSLLVCDFPGKMIPIKNPEYAQYYQAVTGRPTTAEDLLEAADRIESTIRLFNNREGFTRDKDTLPPRAFKEGLLNGPAEGRYIPKEALDTIISEYYALRGWDEQGVPREDTLDRLEVAAERRNPFAPVSGQ